MISGMKIELENIESGTGYRFLMSTQILQNAAEHGLVKGKGFRVLAAHNHPPPPPLLVLGACEPWTFQSI